MTARAQWLALALGAPLFWPGFAAGQVRPPDLSQPFRLRGEMGARSELYQIYGAEPRRPWGTQQLYMNPSMTLMGSVNLSVNLLVSTDQGSDVGLSGLPGRQRLNEFGLHPSWRWGRAHVGTFSESYTSRTFAGLRVRGAGIELNPGLLRCGVFGGSAQRAVFGGLTSGGYARRTVGGRIGLGRDDGNQYASFIQLMVLRTWDDENSLANPGDSGAPVLPSDVAANPFAVTPEENFVVGLAGGAALFAGRLFLKGEIDGAVHTRDRRATPIAEEELDEYPDFMKGIMTPRLGTSGDFAYSTEATLRLPTLPGASRGSPRTLTATVGYHFAGPGYVSLGTPSQFNDYRKLDARAALRVGAWQLRLDGGTQRDNVIGQKTATTTRNRLGGMFTIQPRRGWTSALTARWLGMANDATDPVRQVAYANWTLGTTQSFAFAREARIANIAFTYSLQHAGDDNPVRAGSNLRSHTVDARVTVRLSERLQASPSLGAQRMLTGPDPWTTRMTYGLAGQWQSPGRTWTVTGTATSARYSVGTDALRGGLTVRWRTTTADMLTFGIQSSHYSDVPSERGTFDEHLMSLRWARQF